MTEKKKALFICLGNICRSPIAEAVFLQTLDHAGVLHQWEVESAAIGPWHVGKAPDHRAKKTLSSHAISYDHTARQIKDADFSRFDYIFGMDDENMFDLKGLAPLGAKAKLLLLGDFDPQGERIIKDPYYENGSEGFEKCYQQCVRACDNFVKKHLSQQLDL